MRPVDEARAAAIARGLVGGRETRSGTGTSPRVIEARAAGPGWRLEGHASVTGQETVIAGLFRELVEPGAFAGVLDGDTVHNLEHDNAYVLGRTTAGTLRLSEDGTGLRYEVDLNPRDPQAVSVREKVRRGDLNQASFAFTVERESWRKAGDGEELPLRRILRVGRLWDTSTVAFGAYPQATSGTRTDEAERFAAAAMARRHVRRERIFRR